MLIQPRKSPTLSIAETSGASVLKENRIRHFHTLASQSWLKWKPRLQRRFFALLSKAFSLLVKCFLQCLAFSTFHIPYHSSRGSETKRRISSEVSTRSRMPARERVNPGCQGLLDGSAEQQNVSALAPRARSARRVS